MPLPHRLRLLAWVVIEVFGACDGCAMAAPFASGRAAAAARAGQPPPRPRPAACPGTAWTNIWAAINDGFAEGCFKQSGIGRLRGSLAISDFQEAKTVVHAIPPFQA